MKYIKLYEYFGTISDEIAQRIKGTPGIHDEEIEKKSTTEYVDFIANQLGEKITQELGRGDYGIPYITKSNKVLKITLVIQMKLFLHIK